MGQVGWTFIHIMHPVPWHSIWNYKISKLNKSGSFSLSPTFPWNANRECACRLCTVGYTSTHKCAQKYSGVSAACQTSTCSSQDMLLPHQLHSVHTVSIHCVSKTHKEPSPSIHGTKIEYSLVTRDMPTTEHVILLITGRAGCRGLWWERRAGRGEERGGSARQHLHLSSKLTEL